MSIRLKLTIIFIALVSIPLLFTSGINFSNYKNSLVTSRLSQMQELTNFKAEKFESYFTGLRTTIEMSQNFYNVRYHLPVLSGSVGDQHNPRVVEATTVLDGQLSKMQHILGLLDIMLVDRYGRIVYVSNPEHRGKDLHLSLAGISETTFEQGSRGIYISDIFRNPAIGNNPEIFLAAPIRDLNDAAAGLIVFELGMDPIYGLVRDTTGLGRTGEVLIGRKSGNEIEYLNPLRHDSTGAADRRIRIGGPTGLPMQNAIRGETGTGRSIDYRGKKVIASWRHIPSLGWGLVAKIDSDEAFAAVTNLQHLLILILTVALSMTFIIAFAFTQSISLPIRMLSRGAEIIGRGNLDHRVGTAMKDEIGQLSRAFDKMTHDLKETTASRDELNREINERRQAEEALRESEEKFKAIASNTPDHILVQDRELRYTMVINPQLGLTADEMVGKTDRDILTKEDAENLTTVKRRVIETGTPVHITMPILDKNGKQQFFEGSYVPKYDAQGSVDGLIGYFRNFTERRLAEEALRRSEERFRLALKNAPVSVATQDLDLRFTWAYNQRTVDPARVIGKTDADLFSPDDAARLTALKRKVIDTGTEIREQLWVLSNGKRVFLDLYLEPLRSADGTVTGVGIATVDLTQEKLADAALQRSEERYELAADIANEAIWERNLVTGVEQWNKSYSELFGNPRKSDSYGGWWMELVHPEDRQRVKSSFDEAIADRSKLWLCDYRMKLRDGNWAYIRDRAIIVRDRTGKPFRAVGAKLNVTEQVLATREREALLGEIRAVAARDEAILDNMSESLTIFGPNGDILLANDAARKIWETWGFASQPMNQAGMNAIGVVTVDGREISDDQRPAARVLRGEGFIDYQVRINVRATGASFYGSYSGVPVYDGQGNLLFGIVTLRDITERLRQETDLRTLNRTLKAHNNLSQIMIRAGDETRFLKEACDIIVKDCGYPMVWIGFAGNDAEKSVRPVASAGFEEGYLEKLNVTWAATDQGRGPTGTAIRTGAIAQCRNMHIDPAFAPWRDEAIRRGYASSISLPLKSDNAVFGAITIYAHEPEHFTDEEIALLTDLADDLAFGTTTVRLRVARAAAEAALRSSEERYRSLFDGMTEGFAIHEIICDRNGAPCDYRFLDVNAAFERLTGLRREQVVGRTVKQVLPDEDPKWIAEYGAVALTGTPVHFENYSPALGQHYEVFSYCPAPRQFAVIFLNVTERKRLEAELAENRRQLELLVSRQHKEIVDTRETLDLETQERVRVEGELSHRQQALEAVYAMATDVDSSMSAMNDQVVRSIATILDTPLAAIHYFSDEMRGVGSRYCRGKLNRHDDPAIPCEICRGDLFRKNEPLLSRDSEGHPHRAECFPDEDIESYVEVPIVNGRGVVNGMICVLDSRERTFDEYEVRLIEIFAQYLAHEQMRRELESELAHSSEMKMLGKLTSGVAHEVRNPLNGIMAIMAALSKDLADSERFQPYLRHMQSQVTRLTTLMEDLLALGRPIREDTKIDLPLIPLAESVIASWRQSVRQNREIRFAAPQDGRHSLMVRADGARLEQMIVNLLDNAHQHSSGDKHIDFAIDASGHDTVRLSVRDNGNGIPGEILPRIFEPFFTSRKGGTGLGLSIVRHIVESHGGTVTAENNDNGPGATFTVLLPIARKPD